jgi:hypothetical protein
MPRGCTHALARTELRPWQVHGFPRITACTVRATTGGFGTTIREAWPSQLIEARKPFSLGDRHAPLGGSGPLPPRPLRPTVR